MAGSPLNTPLHIACFWGGKKFGANRGASGTVEFLRPVAENVVYMM